MARDKVLSLISLATKAGRCASGEFLTESETKSGRAGLVVVAEDASENTKKKFRDMWNFMMFPLFSTAIKILWGMQWESSSVHPWQYWTKDLQKGILKALKECF